MLVRGLPLFAAAFLTACLSSAPSAEEIKAEFDAFLETRVACSDASECELVYPGCPLGCHIAVNSAHAAEIESKAAELISEYEEGGPHCDYLCIEVAPACVEGRCETVVP